MRRLILMRHAKSDWSQGASDHDRPLNPRGHRAAAALGDWLRQVAALPDAVLCSTAQRTRDTLDGLALPDETRVTYSRALYLASAEDILAVLRAAKGKCLLLLAHNPGIATAAAQFLRAAPDHGKFQRYPSGATLVAEFEIDDWVHADWGKANARHFTVPRDL
ncbi:histidine phosphatase family protein [Sulfitobacter sp. PS-8MA]|uniref:histidine phosphatase family protein n=1 Tax=Sulfitobacter sp. PS-8MA TaxID=3237707 RepID=UPI0034C619A3